MSIPGNNTFLNQADLDTMRALQAELITEIGGFGDIKRPTYVPNGYGGHSVTFVTQSNIPMRVWISSGPNGTSTESRFWGEQEVNNTDAFLVVQWDTDLQIGDWVHFDSKDWKVVGLQTTDTFHTATRARLESLRHE